MCSFFCSGKAVLDKCDVCGGDDSTCDGSCPKAWEDNCGVCDFDKSNDCQQDCAGVWDGPATEDSCGLCGDPGDPTALRDQCLDCNADVFGKAYPDQCGICVEGNTGKVPCQNDCAGNFFADPSLRAAVDECKICGGDCVKDGLNADGSAKFSGDCPCKKVYSRIDIAVPPIAALPQGNSLKFLKCSIGKMLGACTSAADPCGRNCAMCIGFNPTDPNAIITGQCKLELTLPDPTDIMVDGVTGRRLQQASYTIVVDVPPGPPMIVECRAGGTTCPADVPPADCMICELQDSLPDCRGTIHGNATMDACGARPPDAAQPPATAAARRAIA